VTSGQRVCWLIAIIEAAIRAPDINTTGVKEAR
jgi:hypothetical protein